MENDSNLDVDRRNDVHAMAGLGVEYGTRIGLAVRGEIEAFDEDAVLASLGLLWRIGRSSDGGVNTNRGIGSIDNTGAGDSTNGGLLSGIGSGLGGDDSDADGVPNNLDDCPGTETGQPVTATGCAMFGGVLDGVNFASGSDELTDASPVSYTHLTLPTKRIV